MEEARIVAGVPADAIARVDGDEVRLNQAAEQILRSDEMALRDRMDKRGAPELPRKER